MRGARALLLGLCALAAGASAETAPALVVSSRGLASVVVAGADAGALRAGEKLTVLRGDQPIGEVEVAAAGRSWASCRIVSQSRPIGAGDRLARVATPARPAATPVAPTAASAPAAASPSAASPSVASPAAASPAVAPTSAVASTLSKPPAETPSTAAAAPTPAPPAVMRNAPPVASPAPLAAPQATLSPATATQKAATVGPPATPRSDPTMPAPSVSKPVGLPTPAVGPAPAAGPAEPVGPTAATTVAPGPASPTPSPATAAAGRTPTTAPRAAATPAPSSSAKPAPVPAATPPAPVVVETAAAPPPRAGARFAVKYRSASNVYLDGGRAQGLGSTDRLRIFSGATMVAELEVVYAAEQSASCRVVSETRPVQVGDVAVRMTPDAGVKALVAAAPATPASNAPAAAATTAAAAFGSARSRPAAPWARVRGSASFGVYRTWDQTESNYDFQERTGRLDLGLYDISGQPLSFSLRGRSRQDIRARTLAERTPQSERVDRLYEVAFRYEPPADNVGIEAGRIGIYRFVGIGYLDGVLARFRPVPLVQLGGFAGRNADVETLGYGGTGSKYGGFVRLAPGGRWATGAYDATLAFVREDADGDVSREYLSLESRFGSGSRWSFFERAELDLNRGWRQEMSGKSYQLSNVSLSGNVRVATSAWAYVSYDGRRNYRYYLNRVVPEEVFDDLLHQGLRAGINLNRAGGFGATAGFGMTLKEPDPRNPELEIANAYSFNGGVRHSALFGTPLSAGVDFSGYSNGYTDGGLLLARLGRRFTGGHMVDLSYGRSVYRLKSSGEDRTTQFFRLMGRGELGHRVYLQGDFEYDSGDDLQGPRGFLELGILF